MWRKRFGPGAWHTADPHVMRQDCRMTALGAVFLPQLPPERLREVGEAPVPGRSGRLAAVRLDWPPASAPEVLAGAVGPRTVRLAGAAADGTVLTGGTTPDQVAQARQRIDEGRRAAGRDDPHR